MPQMKHTSQTNPLPKSLQHGAKIPPSFPFTLGQARDRQDSLTILTILCLIKHSITSVYEEGALESMLQIEANLQSTTPLRMLGRKKRGLKQKLKQKGGYNTVTVMPTNASSPPPIYQNN